MTDLLNAKRSEPDMSLPYAFRINVIGSHNDILSLYIKYSVTDEEKTENYQVIRITGDWQSLGIETSNNFSADLNRDGKTNQLDLLLFQKPRDTQKRKIGLLLAGSIVCNRCIDVSMLLTIQVNLCRDGIWPYQKKPTALLDLTLLNTGKKAISPFVNEAVCQTVFRLTVNELKLRYADRDQQALMDLIDEAVNWARENRS